MNERTLTHGSIGLDARRLTLEPSEEWLLEAGRDGLQLLEASPR